MRKPYLKQTGLTRPDQQLNRKVMQLFVLTTFRHKSYFLQEVCIVDQPVTSFRC